MVRPTLIDRNPNELKYYPFMPSLNKCTGSCDILSSKICVPKETKNIYVIAFNLIAIKDESKAIFFSIKQLHSWNTSTSICENSK